MDDIKPTGRPILRHLLIISVVTFLAFSSSLDNGFTNLDDEFHLTENLTIREFDLQHITQIFFSTVNRTYIPLTTLSFAVEYQFFGFDPFGYHLDNLLLHMAVTILVYLLAMRLGLSLSAAFWGALLFGIHPLHVESVAWITERKDVLCAFFYLLSLHAYWGYLQEGKKSSYYFSVLFGFLSVLAKPMAVSLPLIFLLLDWLYQRQASWKLLGDKLLHCICLVPIAFITFYFNMDNFYLNASWLTSLLVYIWTFVFYINKFIFPLVLGPIYALPAPVSLANVHFDASLISFFIILILVYRFRMNKWVVFGFLYYFLSIFFLLRVNTFPDGDVVADRFMYLPSVGFCFLTGYLIDIFWKKTIASKGIFSSKTVLACLSAIYFLLALRTFAQANVWQDSLTLWNYVIRQTPSAALAYNNRGRAYEKKGMWELAVQDYKKCIELNPRMEEAYNNLGLYYKNKRDFSLAQEYFDKALELNPQFYQAYSNRGQVYSLEKRYALALADFGKAVDINPYFTKAYNNRGNVFEALGQNDLAFNDYSQAIAIDRKYADAYYNRGSLYQKEEKQLLALADYDMALKFNQNFTEAYNNRGILYFERGLYDLALRDFAEALRVNHDYAQVYMNRSLVYRAQNRFAEAMEEALKAQKLGLSLESGYLDDLKSKLNESNPAYQQ